MQIASSPGPRARVLVVAGIALTAVSLRSAVTSVGAELGGIRASLGMSGVTAGVLTTLPVICFAAVGALVPAAARRVPARRLVVGGLVADAAGLAGRAVTTTGAAFLAASLIALTGIAVANVMLPVLIKRHFPDRLGLMTGVFSMCVAIGMGVPAAVTVPIGSATGEAWRGGLALWAVPALIAVVPWVLLRRQEAASGTSLPAPEASAAMPAAHPRLIHNSTALGLAVFFGMQSLGAYAVMGWLPR